jgi:protein TonB
MFEQALLTNGPAAKRVWTTCMGVTSQAVLLGFIGLMPLIWPEMLPKPSELMTIVAPGPPPGPPGPRNPEKPRAAHRTAPPSVFKPDGTVTEPLHISPVVPRIIDEAPPDVGGYRVEGSIGGSGNAKDWVMSGVLNQATQILPQLPHVTESAHPATAAAAAPIQRLTIGGVVLEGKIITKIEPPYPALARQLRISGVVDLVAVVGTDGRIRELNLISGHPILAHAAMEAVKKWIYHPTMLDGSPVEVTAPIRVTFRLN